MKIIIVGDLHGEFGELNHLINHKRPQIVLQVGDFGFYPKEPDYDPAKKVKAQGTKIHWCDGNHEDHEALELIQATGQLEVAPGCFYQPRGSILTLPNGRRVLFFGGAESMDKAHRIRGEDWFPQEVPTYSDFAKVLDEPVDIVISHTAPACFSLKKEPPFGYAKKPWLAKFDEPTPKMLDSILEIVKPKQWFFGHYHVHQVGHDCGVDWTALSHPRSSNRWWVELHEKE